MAFLLANNATSTLAAGIGTGDTSITLQSGDGAKFPSPTGGDTFRCTLTDASNNIEIVDVTGRSTDVLTVVRAQEGTVAKAYISGDSIGLRLTAEVIAEFVQKAEAVLKAVVAIKTAGNLTFNDNIQLDFGTDDDVEMYFDGSQFNFDLNGGISLILRDGDGGNATRFTFNIATGELIITGGLDVTGLFKMKGGYSEDVDALATTGAIVCDADAASYFFINGALSGIPTFTFNTTVPSGRLASFTLELNDADAFAPVWPASVDWPRGGEPIWTVGIDIVSFLTRDGGATWHGFVGTLDSKTPV